MGEHKRKRIVVTDEHIARGIPELSSKCMVAEAMKDALPGALKPHADMQTLRYTDTKGIRRTYLTPASVQSALVRFDAGDKVEPFAFFLDTPIQISKPTASTKAKATMREREGHGATRTVVAGQHKAPARIGGRPIPYLKTGTRRKFGIRNLRINQQGKVEQIGVIE